MSQIIGKRVFKSPHSLDPGEYCFDGDRWWAACPIDRDSNGFICLANLKKHNVVENLDGTITVLPSILVSDTKGNQLWHGYLEKGVWREC